MMTKFLKEQKGMSIVGILILGFIVIVLDVAGILVGKVAGIVEVDQYMDLLVKSLSIIGIVLVAALLISIVFSFFNRNK